MHPALQVLVGVTIADFAAAFFHFWEDTYMPYDGRDGVFPAIARDNELHHVLPYSMVSFPIVSHLHVTAPLSLLIAAVVVLAAPRFSKRNWVLLATTVVVGAMSNVFHRWQHERDCQRPAIVTALQNAGLLVGREQHKEHHDDPSKRYGVILGFTNYVYDAGVWDVLRAIIPLRQYPKLVVDAYAHFVPAEIRDELRKDCPKRLSTTDVDGVKESLRRRLS